jgi:hypothetical protein
VTLMPWIDDGDNDGVYDDDSLYYEDEYREPRLEEDSIADWLKEVREMKKETLRMAYCEYKCKGA